MTDKPKTRNSQWWITLGIGLIILTTGLVVVVDGGFHDMILILGFILTVVGISQLISFVRRRRRGE